VSALQSPPDNENRGGQEIHKTSPCIFLLFGRPDHFTHNRIDFQSGQGLACVPDIMLSCYRENYPSFVFKLKALG
jgi:hypothetical protein